MAIDYVIEYDCEPKRQLTAAGIIERIKEKERAQSVIKWFREAGDERPPAQMGFEFSRSTPHDDGEERQLIVVQDLLDHAADLDAHAHHCRHCPANRRGEAYGCLGFIEYPISAAAETWLLDRLPVPDEPLVWLLLRQGIQRFGYDGESVRALRDPGPAGDPALSAYFELPVAARRRLGELRVDADQILEMIFAVGERIYPNHAGILLLFFGAIERDLEAAQIQEISSFAPAIRERLRFEMDERAAREAGVSAFVAFFGALYLAWKLDVPLFVDA